jgi:signal peptidase I
LAITPNLLLSATAVLLLVRLASLVDVVRSPALGPGPLPGWGKTVLVWLALIAVGRLEVFAIRTSLIEAFKIPAGSMSPTLLNGDHILVSKRPLRPQRGQVIVFQYPKDPDKDFVKRIVAVAGDTIEVREGVIWLNGKAVERRHLDGKCAYEDRAEDDADWKEWDCDAWEESLDGVSYSIVFDPSGGPNRSFPPFTVPANSVYVMGDNRDNSHDSRFWGAVPNENIRGRALSIWWSSGASGTRWKRLGTVPR